MSAFSSHPAVPGPQSSVTAVREQGVDIFFSADVETDGPIPGPYSMLSFALVVAGSFDGERFVRPIKYDQSFYAELRPISERFQEEALAVNGLDRDMLVQAGRDPARVMQEAHDWIVEVSGRARPVLVAFPVSFDWTWLYWYFVNFLGNSPFNHSRCYDLKTAFAVKGRLKISSAGRSELPEELRSLRAHDHHALHDAIEQAEIFANIFEWKGNRRGD